MAIPEHDKCVAFNKKNRKRNQLKEPWGHIRKQMRKVGLWKPKMRLLAMLNEYTKRIKNLKRQSSYKSVVEYNKAMLGKHYRRYGKYD